MIKILFIISLIINFILIGFYIYVFISATSRVRKTIDLEDKNEKHVCNTCRMLFVSTEEELNYKYCPYCGEALDFHSSRPVD